MNIRTAVAVFGISASFLLTACTDPSLSVANQSALGSARPAEQSALSPIASPLFPSRTQTLRPDSGGAVKGETPQELLERILADAAARSGLDTSALAIIQDQAVVWPDGSLGCPQPGMMYTQALVDGYHVLIQAGETVLDYRATQRGSFTLCERALRVPPAQTPDK